jgi:hypothetical protein
MVYEEWFADFLKAGREEDVNDLTIFGLEKFSDSNWLPYGGIENNYRAGGPLKPGFGLSGKGGGPGL